MLSEAALALSRLLIAQGLALKLQAFAGRFSFSFSLSKANLKVEL